MTVDLIEQLARYRDVVEPEVAEAERRHELLAGSSGEAIPLGPDGEGGVVVEGLTTHETGTREVEIIVLQEKPPPAWRRRRVVLSVAAASVLLLVGVVFVLTRSDDDTNSIRVTDEVPASTTSTTSPSTTVTEAPSASAPDPEDRPDALPLDGLDPDVLRPLDQIELGDIIVPTAPTSWTLDPEIFIDEAQSAFVVTVWDENADHAFEIWAAPTCESTATRCQVFSYGSIAWPLTDLAAFSDTINTDGATWGHPPGTPSPIGSGGVPSDELAAVIGDYVVVIAPDYPSGGILGLPTVRELITSLRAATPEDLPWQVTPTASGANPDPAAVEAALAPFQPLDEINVMTAGSGGPLPMLWEVTPVPINSSGTGEVIEVVKSRHLIALDDQYGHLDVWTHTRRWDRAEDVERQCILSAEVRLGGGGGLWCDIDSQTTRFAVSTTAFAEPFGYEMTSVDSTLILLNGGSDTVAFVVEDEDGRRVGVVPVDGLAVYRSDIPSCDVSFDLTAIQADGTTHTATAAPRPPSSDGYDRGGCFGGG